jgi:hypothetical protein
MKIFCAYDKLVPLIELESRRHPKNPNTHSAAQVAAIAAVLEGNGWRQPIVVFNRSGPHDKGTWATRCRTPARLCPRFSCALNGRE